MDDNKPTLGPIHDLAESIAEAHIGSDAWNRMSENNKAEVVGDIADVLDTLKNEGYDVIRYAGLLR